MAFTVSLSILGVEVFALTVGDAGPWVGEFEPDELVGVN